jgi:hypothetical protein
MNLQLVYSGLGVPAIVAITGSYYVRLDAPSSDTVLYVREGGLWWPMASVDSATNYTDAVALTTLAAAVAALDAFGALRVVEIPTTVASATFDSLLTLPAGAIVYKAQFVIDTPYDAGTIITMGQPGFTTIFVAAADNFTADTVAGDIYIKEQATPASAVAVARVTVSGAPAAGAGRAQLFFSVPQV